MEDMRSLMRSFSLPRHLCSPKKVVFEAGIEYVNRGEFVGGCDVEGEDLVTDLTADWSEHECFGVDVCEREAEHRWNG
jgi:hypothetical protein